MNTQAERLLMPAEVARMFRVKPKTVSRWAKAGLLTAVTTPGGHRRFRQAEVFALLRAADPITHWNRPTTFVYGAGR